MMSNLSVTPQGLAKIGLLGYVAFFLWVTPPALLIPLAMASALVGTVAVQLLRGDPKEEAPSKQRSARDRARAEALKAVEEHEESQPQAFSPSSVLSSEETPLVAEALPVVDVDVPLAAGQPENKLENQGPAPDPDDIP